MLAVEPIGHCTATNAPGPGELTWGMDWGVAGYGVVPGYGVVAGGKAGPLVGAGDTDGDGVRGYPPAAGWADWVGRAGPVESPAGGSTVYGPCEVPLSASDWGMWESVPNARLIQFSTACLTASRPGSLESPVDVPARPCSDGLSAGRVGAWAGTDCGTDWAAGEAIPGLAAVGAGRIVGGE
jgi:hypothetical protein